MNIFKSEINLVKDGAPADVHELADRVDLMHEYLVSQENVRFADIVVAGGSEISINLALRQAEDETKADTENRVDVLLAEAFERAAMTLESAEHALENGHVREFSCV